MASELHNSPVNVEIIRTKEDECDHIQFAITEQNQQTNKDITDLDVFEHSLSSEPKISPASFCRAFPFHLLFDRDLVIQQAGTSISRVIPKVCHV